MGRLLIQLAVATVFVVFVFRAFRFAMGLRWARLEREAARRAEVARGRRVVAELPAKDGTLGLLVEGPDSFEWPGGRVAKADIVGCRLLLNGGVIASASREGASLPEPTASEEYEGRERWDVRVYLVTGTAEIACGSVREGVSREIGRAAFEAVRAAIAHLGHQ